MNPKAVGGLVAGLVLSLVAVGYLRSRPLPIAIAHTPEPSFRGVAMSRWIERADDLDPKTSSGAVAAILDAAGETSIHLQPLDQSRIFEVVRKHVGLNPRTAGYVYRHSKFAADRVAALAAFRSFLADTEGAKDALPEIYYCYPRPFELLPDLKKRWENWTDGGPTELRLRFVVKAFEAKSEAMDDLP